MENIVPLKKSPRNCLAAKFSVSPTPPPPIGVFWDIENCQVPRGKSAGALVQLLRTKFFANHREAEFLCVCDISKERKDVIQELNLSQITVIHINATSKNAADEKLKQCMHRFADTFGSSATIILISGDVNFAPHLSDFRHRQHIRVILIHGSQAPEALIVCAHEHYNFAELTKSLPPKDMPKPYSAMECELLVSELPRHRETSSIHLRLRRLSDNCGGRVLTVSQEGTALIRFPNPQAAQRAKKRMDKEDVFGSKISVGFPSQREHTAIMSTCRLRSRRTMSSGGSSSSRDSSPRATQSDFEAVSPLHKHMRHRHQKYSSHVQAKKKEAGSPASSKSATTGSDSMAESVMPPPPSPIYPKSAAAAAKSPKSVGRVSPFVSELRFCPIVNPPFPPPPTDYHVHWNTQESSTVSTSDSAPVELLITNLDHSFETNEMKKILASLFGEHVMVLHMAMMLHPPEMKAVVKVPSLQDAQVAISQLHRRKVGGKRILISYLASQRATPPHLLRAEVIALLQAIPPACFPLPLFKFRELFEKRYQRNMSLSDLYRMDCLTITEGSSGRMVSINPDYRHTPSPADMEQEEVEMPYCERHYEVGGEGWEEREPVYPLPDVSISLKCLAARVHTLLDGHGGRLPLNSFCACYRAEFGELPLAPPTDGVPLEHLLSSIPGVQVERTDQGIKRLQWMENKEQPDGVGRSVSPALQGPLSLFCREVVDLLKARPGGLLPFTQFIPEYHHHFGRQCRVADLGFTRLADLLEAVPHVLQVLGQGSSRRVVTLSHTAQVRRFASELSRVLKSTARPLAVSELPTAFTNVVGRPFRLADYGVCDLDDLLGDVDSSSLQITKSGEDTLLSIPKKEQSPEEMARTKQFEKEVVELLRHMPRCIMPFSRFIPSYHHHFGRQCRLADFGVAKLLDLFELIPHIVTVSGVGEEKELHLAPEEYQKVVADRVQKVLQKAGPTHLPQTYREMFGTALRPEDAGAVDLETLLSTLAPSSLLPPPQLVPLQEDGGDENSSPTPLSHLGEQLVGLVRTKGGQMQVSGLESAYQAQYGAPCPRLGFPSLGALLQALPSDTGLAARGRKGRKTLVLLPDARKNHRIEVSAKSHDPDLMDQPVPSDVPSPDLQPELSPEDSFDLMGFESPLPPPHPDVAALLQSLVDRTEDQKPRRPRIAAQFSVPLQQ